MLNSESFLLVAKLLITPSYIDGRAIASLGLLEFMGQKVIELGEYLGEGVLLG